MNLDHPLMSLAVTLVTGIIGGELFTRIKLPKVTGWIATGILVRALGLPGLTPGELNRFAPFTDFVLGFIAFTVGAALHIPSLRNAGKRLSLLLLTEATITPACVAAALVFIGGQSLGLGLVMAAIAVAAAPGTTVVVVQEARARGVLVKTLLAAVALIDMVAVGGFAAVQSYLRTRGAELSVGTFADAIGAVGVEFAVAGAVALGCTFIALFLLRVLVGPAFLGPLMVSVILASWGLAQAFDVSSILSCTLAGVAMSNIRHDTARAAEGYLHPFSNVLFAGFYTFAGMRLDFSLVVKALGLVALFFGARLTGKVVSSFVAMSLARMTMNVRKYLGIALLPHGGVAVGLILLVQDDPSLASMHDTVAAVGLAALAINQLIGPSATRFALQRTGEAGQNRPRLLDFLKEQHIEVNLQAKSKQEVIEKLTDRLYTTTQLHIAKPTFLEDVLRRENEESTCLGEGFMIPHVTHDGDEVVGVLGLSSEGLDLGAPDGRLVHAVVLLATPETDRKRHLEILAAFASAITRDASMREQLYHARSAAHAYQVIHASDAEDFNYFLEDTMAGSTAKP